MVRMRLASAACVLGAAFLLPTTASADFITTCDKGEGNWTYHPAIFLNAPELEQARTLVRGEKGCPDLRWDMLPGPPLGSPGHLTVERKNFAYFIKKANFKKCIEHGNTATPKTTDATFQVVVGRSSDAKRWEQWADQLYVKRSLWDAVKEAVTENDTTDLQAYAKANVGSFGTTKAAKSLFSIVIDGAPAALTTIVGIDLTPALVVAAGIAVLRFAYDHTCQGKFEKMRGKALMKYFRKAAEVPNGGAIVYTLSTSAGVIYEEVDAVLQTDQGPLSIPVSGTRSKLIFE